LFAISFYATLLSIRSGAKLGIVSKTNHGSRSGIASGAVSVAAGVIGDGGIGAPGQLPGLHNTYDAIDGTSEQNFFL